VLIVYDQGLLVAIYRIFQFQCVLFINAPHIPIFCYLKNLELFFPLLVCNPFVLIYFFTHALKKRVRILGADHGHASVLYFRDNLLGLVLFLPLKHVFQQAMSLYYFLFFFDLKFFFTWINGITYHFRVQNLLRLWLPTFWRQQFKFAEIHLDLILRAFSLDMSYASLFFYFNQILNCLSISLVTGVFYSLRSYLIRVWIFLIPLLQGTYQLLSWIGATLRRVSKCIVWRYGNTVILFICRTGLPIFRVLI